MVREARFQDTKNRQNSIDVDQSDIAQIEIAKEFEDRQLVHIAASEEHYRWSESHGIALEQARVFLPEGNTLSRMYMNADLRSLIHYCSPILGVRYGNGTQKEHIEVAKACWEVVAANFPMIADALEATKEQD
jgi:thymidylate synthase (FAD)